MHEAIDVVTQNDWEKCVRYAEGLQDTNYIKEFRDCVMEPIILKIG